MLTVVEFAPRRWETVSLANPTFISFLCATHPSRLAFLWPRLQIMHIETVRRRPWPRRPSPKRARSNSKPWIPASSAMRSRPSSLAATSQGFGLPARQRAGLAASFCARTPRCLLRASKAGRAAAPRYFRPNGSNSISKIAAIGSPSIFRRWYGVRRAFGSGSQGSWFTRFDRGIFHPLK